MHSLSPKRLAAQVVDALDDLNDHHQAFEAVERLISVTKSDSQEDLSHLDRRQLSWLFLVLNAALRDCICKAKRAADAAYEQQHSGAKIDE